MTFNMTLRMGKNKNHSLKLQAITAPVGLVLHAHGPMARCTHDWTLYVNSGTEVQLYTMCLIHEEQYYIQGGTGYNRRHCLDVLISRASLTAAQRAAKRETGGVRVTLE